MAVLIREADVDRFPRVERDAPGTLNMEKKELYRIIYPGDLSPGEPCTSFLYRRAVVVRHDAPAVQPSAQAEFLQLRVHVAEIDGDQVLWHTENGKAIAAARLPASAEKGLVVAGDQSFRSTLGSDYLKRHKMGFEETARGVAIGPCHGLRGRAGFAPDALRGEGAAACQKSTPRPGDV